MSNLYVSVVYNGSNPAESVAVAAYNASKFVLNPKTRSPLPQQAADATATTDSSGDAEFTGLSTSDNYWVAVTDVDGYHWTFVLAGRVGNTSSTRVPLSYVLASIVTAPT